MVPATAARARPRVASRRVTLVTRAFIPNMIPNPAYRWGDDTNPDAPQKASLDDMRPLGSTRSGGWATNAARRTETDTVWRTFKARDEKSARVCLDLLQEELYVNNEQGCRIRRETQGIFYILLRRRARAGQRPQAPSARRGAAARRVLRRARGVRQAVAKVEEVCKKAKAA